MSRQRLTEGEEDEGYPYYNSGYGDEGQQRFPSHRSPHSQQGYQQMQQPNPQQGYLQRYQQQQQQQFSTYRNNNSYLDNDEGETGEHVLKDGWLFRPPENGHVITKGEIVSRIVQYYEMFVVNVFLLGYNVLRYAKSGVEGSTIKNFLVDACGDRFHIEQFDYCAASRLFWGLIGGAVIYFIFTSIVAFSLSIELSRKGFHSSFTALWHSPVFIICFFYPQEKRVDILSIPNKYVELSLWTRGHVHRICLAIYCASCSILILVSLNRGTAETAVIEGEGLDKGFKKYYNPFLIPYYLSLYIFSKTLINMLLTIIQDKDIRNRPERIGQYYNSIKKR